MPRIHFSVRRCARCDLFVAANLMQPCDNACGAIICPQCSIPTLDANLFVCSERCESGLNERICVKEFDRQEAQYAEA